MIIRSISGIIHDRVLPRTAPGLSVREACSTMCELNVGALTVLEGDNLVGVLSERDVVRECICHGRSTAETRVAEIMTPDPVTIGAEDPLAEALKRMVQGGFRHLPVIEAGRTVGLLSIRDIPTEYRIMLERYTEYLDPTALSA